VAPLVGVLLVFGGMIFAIVQFAPCAFASSEPSFDSVIASAERLLQVEPPIPATPDPDGTVVLDLSVRQVRPGGAVGAASNERVAIYGSFVGDIRAALDDGSLVFLAMTFGFREEVSFVVARDSDGKHSFLGGCLWGPGSKWLRELLGPRFDPAMERIIGLTDPDAIYRILADVDDPGGRALVEYGDRPSNLAMFARTGRLVERAGCLAVETEVGPLVPIFDDDYFYLARDDIGLVLMSVMQEIVHVGKRVELKGREMSPEEALAVTDRASLERCPGRLILVSRISRAPVPEP
jgi:hypothetical protein